MAELDRRLMVIAQKHRPIGARGVFYRAVVMGLVPKDEAAVRLIQRRILKLRREGTLPYPWIVDDSREVYGRNSYGDLNGLADEVAGLYRRDYWRRSDCWVQVWLEKRTMKGVIQPVVVEKWGLEIYSCNGQPSESLIWRGGEDIKRRGVPTHVYVLSDFDPAGDTIFKALAEGAQAAPGGLARFAGGVPVHVQKLALTPEQVRERNLPTRPAKKSDRRSAKFIEAHGDVSVELDALPPNDFREMIDGAIARHMPAYQLDALKEIEKDERHLAEVALRIMARQDDTKEAPER